MTHMVITLVVILATLVLFAWNVVPAAVVAIGASLILYLTGVLTMREAVEGFGDPVVILIAALLAIAAGLEKAGIGAWAGQQLIRRTGANATQRVILIMLLAAVFSALIGMNGAVAAMLPVVVVVALRTGEAPSRLMFPLALGCLTGSMLTLLGTPVNVIAAGQAEEAGVGHIGFFEWSVVGLPLLAGTIAIVVLFGRWLLPDRAGQSIPVDLSRHAQTLVEHYQLETRLHRLRVGPDSKLVGQSPDSVAADSYDGLSLVAVTDGQSGATRAGALRAGDVLLVRGDPGAAARMAADLRLAAGEHDGSGELESALLNRDTGLAEVIVPARSKLIGQTVFPGMVTEGPGLMILAIQRGAEDTRQAPTAIQAGDHLLLRGPWEALDRHLAGPQTLAVDAPDVVQRQAVALGRSAPQAIGILVLLVVLLAFNIVPPVIAALICASLMVVARVLTLPQVYRGIDWNTVILIAAMIPPATAMAKTGAAHLIGDHIIGLLGAFGPDAVLIGVFLVAAAVSQFISNTSAALVMMPIGLATAAELQVSALPLLMAVAMGASASFLTPFANGVSIMVYGPGGYRFGDFWKLGSLVMLWALLVTAVVVPWHWPFR